MTFCESTGCGAQADVTVEQANGSGTNVCSKHLTRLLLDGRNEVRGFRRLDWVPTCFYLTCDEPAVAVARNPDDLPVPACRTHLDDLSWIELPEPLLTDEPGWSRG